MSKKRIKFLIINIIVLSLVYMFFLQIFSYDKKYQIFAERDNSDNLLYYVPANFNDANESKNKYKKIYTTNFIDMFDRYDTEVGLAPKIIKSNEDKIAFYENFEDKSDIKIDLLNYDMTPFKTANSNKTIFPVIVDQAQKDTYPIGSTFFEFTFNSYEINIDYAFIVVAYANTAIDYMFHKDYTPNEDFAIVNYKDYKKCQEYLGVGSNTRAFYKYNWLVSIFRSGYTPYSTYNQPDNTVLLPQPADFSWTRYQNASTLLSDYDDSLSNEKTMYIGKVPTEKNEIALEVSSTFMYDYYSSKENRKKIEDVNIDEIKAELNKNIMIKLYAFKQSDKLNLDDYYLFQDFKIVGVNLTEGLYSDYIYISDASFKELQNHSSYTSYVTGGSDDDNMKLLGRYNSYVDKNTAAAVLTNQQTYFLTGYSVILLFIFLLALIVSTVYLYKDVLTDTYDNFYYNKNLKKEFYNRRYLIDKLLYYIISFIIVALLSYIIYKFNIFSVTKYTIAIAIIAALIIQIIFEISFYIIINKIGKTKRIEV